MHDVLRLRGDLVDAFSQDKRHLGFLIGAGCPASVRITMNGRSTPLIPDIMGLTSVVCESLATSSTFPILRKLFEEDGTKNPNVEQMLTTVRHMLRVTRAGTTRGLQREDLENLERCICDVVYNATCVELPSRDTSYHKFCRWIRDIEREVPITILTTNYDLLLEQALEDEEVPYFDGFAGARRPFFDIRAIESDLLPPRWVRLWKLHGSINWRLVDTGRLSVVREMNGTRTGGQLLVHPSELKYDQSRRMPYLAMFDRLRFFLRTPGAVLVTCGYSFADDHLNEALIQGLVSNPTATVFGLLYKTFDEEAAAVVLSSRAPSNLALLAKDGALIRRRREAWTSADATAADDGTGARAVREFDLGDFDVLASFMEGMTEAGHGRPDTRS